MSKEFDWWEWKPKTTAEHIVSVLHHDMRDRRGLRQELEQIDSDIMGEIIYRHVELVEQELKK